MSEQQSKSPHTPEPWGIENTKNNLYIGPLRPDGKIAYIVCAVEWCDDFKDSAKIRHAEDARRIIACVNALAGVSTETLEILIAQGNGKYVLNVEATQAKVKKLEAQRDELLNALSPFSKYACDSYAGDSPCACYNCIARDLIAKIEAEKNKNG